VKWKWKHLHMLAAISVTKLLPMYGSTLGKGFEWAL
jgi:hypothetical protein